MARRGYNVNGSPGNSHVSAWKSATCTLLILATITLILCLIAWSVKRDEVSSEKGFDHPKNHSNIAQAETFQGLQGGKESERYFHKHHHTTARASSETTENIVPINNVQITDASIGDNSTEIHTKDEHLDQYEEINDTTTPVVENEKIVENDVRESNETSPDQEDLVETPVIYEDGNDNETNHKNSDHTSHAHYEIESPSALIKLEECASTICKESAVKILNLMTFGEEQPCDDFFTFACSRSNKEIMKASDDSLWNKILYETTKERSQDDTEYYGNFKDYFLSCTNFDPSSKTVISDVQNNLRRIGDFCTSPYQNRSLTDLSSLLAIMLLNNYAALFDITINNKFDITITPINQKHSILQNNKRENHYERLCLLKQDLNETVNLEDQLTQYKECVRNETLIDSVQEAFLKYKIFDDMDEQEKGSVIEEILEALQLLLLYLDSEPNNKDDKKKVTILDLKNNIDMIDWTLLFNKILNGYITDDFTVDVISFKKLTELFKKMKSMDVRNVYNGVLALYLHKLHRDFSLDQTTLGDRRLYCIQVTSNFMEDLSSSIYLDSLKESELKYYHEISQKIFGEIKKSFQSNIEYYITATNDMEKYKEQIRNLQLFTAYDHRPWRNKTALSFRMENINITSDGFVTNTAQLERRLKELEYGNLKYNVAPDSILNYPDILWSTQLLPYDSNPTFIQDTNVIVLPFVNISPELPDYLKLSDLGAMLAREISRFIRRNELHLHAEGSFPVERIFSTLEQREYENIQFEMSDIGMETTKDIIGLNLAYNTYKERFEASSGDLPLVWINKTIDQIFFLRAAQQFCSRKILFEETISSEWTGLLPSHVRTNTLVASSEGFQKAFACDSSGSMKGGYDMRLKDLSRPSYGH